MAWDADWEANSKLEPRNSKQSQMTKQARNKHLSAGLEHFPFGICLFFRASDFGFRISRGDYYHLSPDPASPCIDHGNDGAVIGDTDIDYEARIAGEHVDVGADEYVTDPNAPDPTIPIYIAAVATGEDESSNLKIALYWNAVEGSSGYNVYRGTTPGGENLQTPINGSTPITTLSYPESNAYVYTDVGDLEEGVTYYYVVTALGTAWGESNPSEETSCAPNPAGIPWDTGDAEDILAAARAAFPEEIIPLDCVTVGGPDGRYYMDGSSDLLLSEGYVDPGNKVVRDDGETCFAANAPWTDEGEGEGLLSVQLGNAATGPFRRVVSRKEASYRGIWGKFSVPGATHNSKYHPTLYSASVSKELPADTAETVDAPYVYYGITSPKADIEGGVVWQRWRDDPVAGTKPYRWRLYMKTKAPHVCRNCKAIDPKTKKPLQGWLQHNPRQSFDGPISNADMMLYVSRDVAGLVKLKVTLPSDPSNPLIMLHQFGAGSFPCDAIGNRVRRVHSIAQNDLGFFKYKDLNGQVRTYAYRGYMNTGSKYFGSAFSEGKVWRFDDPISSPRPWNQVVTKSGDEGAFPFDPRRSSENQDVVSWHPVSQYIQDNNVKIDLQ